MKHRYLKGTFVWLVLAFMLLGALPSMAAAVDRALLVQDILPWDSTANTDALDFIGASYDTTTSDQLAAIDLTQYKVVIYGSDQNQDFYDSIDAAMPQIESYVAQGGVLVAHGACGNTGSWEDLAIAPGGLSMALNYGENISVNMGHPVFDVSDDPDYFNGWGSSTHGDFTAIPPSALVIADSEYGPAYVDYSYGLGRVMASLFTVEFAYSERAKPEFLQAELYEALNSTQIAVGTVRDVDSSAPVAGAEVYAFTSSDGNWIGTTVSGPDGTYAVWDVFHWGAGSYHIETAADGYLYDSKVIEWDGVSPTATDIDLIKADTIAAGVVYDTVSDSPIAAAYIEAWHVVGGEWYWAGDTWTEADGTFTIGDEALEGPGDYSFVVWADGYYEGGGPATWDGSPLVQNFALAPVPRIASGSVYDADSNLISDAMVSAYLVDDMGEWWWVGDAYTDGSGAFTLLDYDQIGAGDYRFEARSDGFVTNSQDYSWNGMNELNFDFYLDYANVLALGLVTDVVTSDAVAEAWVDAYWYDTEVSEYQWVGSAESAFDGYYTIYDTEVKGAGTYLLQAASFGYQSQSWEGAGGGIEPMYVDFELQMAPVVATGTVADSATSDPIYDAFVEITRYNTDDDYWEGISATWSAEDGSYTLRDDGGYGPGEYRFTASARGYITAEVTQTWDGETPLPLDFALEAREIALDAYEPDNTPAQAKSILTNGTLQEHTLCLAGDSDWMTFSAEAGLDYTIETSVLDWTETDTWLSLYESDGETLIDENDDVDDGLYSRIVWTAPADMNVYVRVTELGDNLGDYRISVSGADGSVISVSGADRFSTGVKASELAYPEGANTVIIATGRNWPDALGGTALAGALNGPILLVDTNVLPTSVSDEIDRLGATEAIILGGTSAVGTAVETALNTDLGEENVDRIAGGSRYETADLVALRTIEILGVDYDGTAFVATGGNFPDALAAAPLAAAQGWPLYLANPKTGLAAATKTAMADVQSVLILGGETVVTPATETYLTGEYGVDFVTRLAGDDRYKTAIAIATYAVEEAGHMWDRVGITTGANFPDALAGGVLQGQTGSVMLLTKSFELNTDVEATLSANKASINMVTFFGGMNAVQQTVRDAVADALATDI